MHAQYAFRLGKAQLELKLVAILTRGVLMVLTSHLDKPKKRESHLFSIEEKLVTARVGRISVCDY